MKLDATFKRRCEGITVDWRYRFDLQPYDPLPAERILTALNGKAITPDQMPNMPPESIAQLTQNNDWSAGIILPKPLLIVYHPSHSSTRRQSDLMHEIGHVLLDHPMIGFDSETGLPVRDARCEDEATYLGGCLQIPRLGLQWAIQQGYGIRQIALHFGASEQMVRFRSNMTGVNLH